MLSTLRLLWGLSQAHAEHEGATAAAAVSGASTSSSSSGGWGRGERSSTQQQQRQQLLGEGRLGRQKTAAAGKASSWDPNIRCICFASPAVANEALMQEVTRHGWQQYISNFVLPEDPVVPLVNKFLKACEQQPHNVQQGAADGVPADSGAAAGGGLQSGGLGIGGDNSSSSGNRRASHSRSSSNVSSSSSGSWSLPADAPSNWSGSTSSVAQQNRIALLDQMLSADMEQQSRLQAFLLSQSFTSMAAAADHMRRLAISFSSNASPSAALPIPDFPGPAGTATAVSSGRGSRRPVNSLSLWDAQQAIAPLQIPAGPTRNTAALNPRVLGAHDVSSSSIGGGSSSWSMGEELLQVKECQLQNWLLAATQAIGADAGISSGPYELPTGSLLGAGVASCHDLAMLEAQWLTGSYAGSICSSGMAGSVSSSSMGSSMHSRSRLSGSSSSSSISSMASSGMSYIAGNEWPGSSSGRDVLQQHVGASPSRSSPSRSSNSSSSGGLLPPGAGFFWQQFLQGAQRAQAQQLGPLQEQAVAGERYMFGLRTSRRLLRMGLTRVTQVTRLVTLQVTRQMAARQWTMQGAVAASAGAAATATHVMGGALAPLALTVPAAALLHFVGKLMVRVVFPRNFPVGQQWVLTSDGAFPLTHAQPVSSFRSQAEDLDLAGLGGMFPGHRMIAYRRRMVQLLRPDDGLVGGPMGSSTKSQQQQQQQQRQGGLAPQFAA